jgi:ceramide glucosyltransferase
VIYLLLALAATCAAFQSLALIAAVKHRVRRDPAAHCFPPVSILKPVHGLDEDFVAAIRSHALLDYPEYEILFGSNDPNDPAVDAIRQLAAEFPDRAIRLVAWGPSGTGLPACPYLSPQPVGQLMPQSAATAKNGKVGVLMKLAAVARYPILIVNDSDIRVEPDYLQRVVAPLEDPAIGMVTCLYRGRAHTLAGRLEAVGIATDFIPGVLVAPLVGVSEFALGSTMAFRAADLERIGGFGAIRDYLADDYQLSRHIRGLGLKVWISQCVVETSLGSPGWLDAWRHQVRWARTVRVSRPGGYAGLPLSNAALWAVLLAACGLWPWAAALYALRLAVGLTAGLLVLGDRALLCDAWLIPLRDLAGLAIWAAGLFGKRVVWRGQRLILQPDGRIVEES